MKRKILVSVSLMCLMVFGVAGTSFASTSGTTPVSITIKAGQRSISAPGVASDFSSFVLNGQRQTATANLNNFTVTDASGSGDGWHVTASATQMADGQGHKLPSGSLTLASPIKVTDAAASSSALPAIEAGKFSIDSQGYTLLTADQKQGMGTYDVSFPTSALTLSLEPGSTFVDAGNGNSSYNSTITWTIVSGP